MKHLLALFLVLGVPALANSSQAQPSAAQRPIMCGETEKKIEDADCRDKLSGIFSRNGDTLTLNLDDGKSKAYVGNSAACDSETVDVEKCLVYSVLGYLPQTQSLLISAGLYECGDVLLINRRTGSETVISYEVPVLSPGARYLVSTDQNEACERHYDIAIWSMATDPPTLEFKYNAKENEYWEVRDWQDDRRANLKVRTYGTTAYDQEAELVRNDNGWALVLGKKTERKQ